jgi:hypothetical protein
MKSHRLLLIGLGLGVLVTLAATGCFITSGQVFAHFALPNPFTIDSSTDPFERVLVDLNTIKDYADHKDKLKGLADVAVIGKFTNVAGPAGGVEVWITPDETDYTTIGEVQAGATKLWGPGTIGAAGSVHTVTWAESAKLFNSAGKTILINESKGDGVFTIYTHGTMGTYDIRVDGGEIVLVLSAGL